MNMSRAIAGVVRAELQKRQMSDAELARRAGIPKASLSRKLNGESKLFIDDAAALASALGWSLSTLMRRAETAPASSLSALADQLAADVNDPEVDALRAKMRGKRKAK